MTTKNNTASADAEYISFDATREEHELISKIVQRAMSLDYPGDSVTLSMDLTAIHANGNPMDLGKLLAADEWNFVHDIYGISRHIDRTTGKLMDCFVPRFSCKYHAGDSAGIAS